MHTFQIEQSSKATIISSSLPLVAHIDHRLPKNDFIKKGKRESLVE
jgi:hypothetical protein